MLGVLQHRVVYHCLGGDRLFSGDAFQGVVTLHEGLREGGVVILDVQLCSSHRSAGLLLGREGAYEARLVFLLAHICVKDLFTFFSGYNYCFISVIYF